MSTAQNGQIVTNGLVLALDAANTKSYDSGSSVWRDLTPYNLSGSLINGPTYNSNNGGSIVFDGSNDYAEFGDPSYLRLSTSVTIEAWIKGSQWTGSSIMAIAGRWNTGGRSYKISIWGDLSGGANRGKAYIDVSGTGAGDNYVLSTNVLDVNVWYSITGVYNGISLKTYVNGIDRSGTLVGSIPSSLYTGTSGAPTIYVGLDTGAISNCFNGSISCVRIYNRALSATEILQNYNATKTRFGL